MRRVRFDLIVIAIIALLSNFAYLALSSGDLYFPDSATYLAPARHLLEGIGFVTTPGVPETLRTPGYPLFILPFLAAGLGATAIVLVQHLLEAAIACFVYLLAVGRFGRRAALAAALVMAVDTPSIHIANKVLSETLFTAMLLALFALAWRLERGAEGMRWFIGAGVLAGALVLVRPVAILYFMILALFFVRRNRMAAVAVFLSLALFFPAAWALRNRARTGVFTVSSVAGVNMLLHRAAASMAILDGGDFKSDLADRQEEVHGDADEEIQTRLGVGDAEELDQAVRSSWYGRVGRRIALQHPLGLALLTVRGVLVNLFESDWEAAMLVSTLPESLIQLALGAWTHLVVFLALAGIAILWRGDRPFALLAATTIVYFIVISAGSEAEYRFRVPVMPMIALAAGCGLDGFLRLASRDREETARTSSSNADT